MSKLGMGLMRLPLMDENDQTSIDYEEVNKMVDAYMDAGFDYFDTAFVYHEGVGEAAFRKCVVERYPRESFKIATKLPLFVITEESQLEPIFAQQLENCGVDYIDYYMLHNVSGFTENAWKNVDLYSFIQKKKEEGYIKHIGISTHGNAEFLEEILFDHPELEFVLLQINYLDWEDEGIESRKCLEVARKYNKQVMIMEPYKGGFLADVPEEAEKIMKEYNPDRSVVSWAMRFVANIEDVEVVLTGASNLEQLESNIREFNDADPLNDEEMEIISQVSEIINSNITVDCTKCRYCVDTCPEDIDIAKIFDLYNKHKLLETDEWTQFGNAYLNYSKLDGVGIASDCIECENCIEECPQQINIPEVLKDVAKTFETEIYGFTD
ncbi:MAG: aldo/keto reductase [Methanobrevibacter sp.]|uniref:aldo/keto reductase n=1 Tax=Methanobrevibacter sp. TaxID=66852 RepID=UPI00257EF2E3|nr:aldo/keto reductase [Methanobrevibacter sp.]MBR2666112.1 aldo/keto reductase [Methanobrevibacter sp.]MBR3198105.1 aldo/keto reductase [Methanobrevibacter sp.]MBR6928286.1 aldo/keto reductase [Methanobrevibacter sp.]MBR7051225.1 aldo/keto reductase [Methanobrevibacter sp.]